jgi:hypothetical protein
VRGVAGGRRSPSPRLGLARQLALDFAHSTGRYAMNDHPGNPV